MKNAIVSGILIAEISDNSIVISYKKSNKTHFAIASVESNPDNKYYIQAYPNIESDNDTPDYLEEIINLDTINKGMLPELTKENHISINKLVAYTESFIDSDNITIGYYLDNNNIIPLVSVQKHPDDNYYLKAYPDAEKAAIDSECDKYFDMFEIENMP